MVKHHGLPAVSEQGVLRKIAEVKEYINQHQESLPNTIYEALNGVSKTFLAYKDSGGAPGWASTVTNAVGETMWTANQAVILEETAPLLAAGAVQAGGGSGPAPMKPEDFHITALSKFVTSANSKPFSLDEIVGSVQQYLAAIDEKNRELAKIIGPVAIVNSMTEGRDIKIGPSPPYLPIGIPIPTRTILPIVNAILESCRLLVSNYFFDVSILRKILSIVLAMYDIARGEWRDGVLSFIGVFSHNMMVAGMIGKTARWVYNFISPDIQRRISSDMYDGFKSMCIGYWLWLFSVVSPDYVRNILTTMINSAQVPIDEINKKIASVEEQAQKTAAPTGMLVKFPRIPLDAIPSFDDIQNFQSLLHRPEIICNPAFQTAIQPALMIAPLRFVLEMLSIPITPEAKAETCKDVPASFAESVTDALKPTIIPAAGQDVKKGGFSTRYRKTLKRKRFPLKQLQH
jgi:hypothetical protein